MLAGDAARGPVLHEADVVDVGHLRAPDAGIDPADHVAEDALGVVVELVLDLVVGPVGAGSERNGQDVVERRLLPGGQLGLAGEHVDLVIVGGVQRGRGRRRDPGAVGAGVGVPDLLVEHVGHHVGRRPHALADLGHAPQPAGHADVDVPVLVGTDPGLRLHRGLGHERAGLHRGVDLVAGAVEEAGVDERHAGLGGPDALGEVHRGAALLVHDPQLHGVLRQAQGLFDEGEDLVGERHLVGAVHLGLHHIDRAVAGVALAAPGQVVHGAQDRDHGVDQALGRFVAVAVMDGRVGHQVADVADQQQGTTRQGDGALAVGSGVGAVGVEPAGECLVALGDLFGEVALHQAQPVVIGERLVFGVDGGDRVLAVHDCGDRRLEMHVGNAGAVGGAHRVGGVDPDLDAEAVLAQHHRGGRRGITRVADELARVGEAGGRAVGCGHQQGVIGDGVGSGTPVGSCGQGHAAVEELASPGDHPIAARRVVRARGRGVAHGVGAVERVVQRAPAGVGRVERVAGVHDRHDQLRAGDRGDLGVDVLGVDREGRPLGHQVAELLEEGPVLGGVMALAPTLAMPVVDGRLHVGPDLEELTVAGPVLVDELRQPVPEGVGIHPAAGEGLVDDEVVEGLADVEVCDTHLRR